MRGARQNIDESRSLVPRNAYRQRQAEEPDLIVLERFCVRCIASLDWVRARPHPRESVFG